MAKRTYKGRTIKDLTSSDKTWQKLRESMVGTWKKDPEGNVRKLRSYLGNIKTTSNEKLIIVLNYLVGSAFRMGIIKHPSITKLRKEIVEEIKRRKQEGTWRSN